jgi:hypothetical protein
MAYDLTMAFWHPVQPRHVRQAVAEYGQLGWDELVARHSFGPARAYLLILDGKSNDSKAILGVAYQPAGRLLSSQVFSGGVHSAADVLRVGIPVGHDLHPPQGSRRHQTGDGSHWTWVPFSNRGQDLKGVGT